MRKKIRTKSVIDEVMNDSIKLSGSKKSKVNKILNDTYGKVYHDKIPLKEIFNTLRENKILVVQEDGSEWEGFLTGDKGRADFELKTLDETTGTYKSVKDCLLIMTWYKMQSGRYEIVIYLS